MTIKKDVIGNWLLVIGVISIGFILFLVFSNKPSSSVTESETNSTIEGDVQFIDVTAKGGYSPKAITAQAGKDTILRIKTQNTFDCSSAFTIPQLGVYKQLPTSGVTEFKLGVREKDEELIGTCTMGMYSFEIQFK